MSAFSTHRAALMQQRQIKLGVSRWEREYVLAQQAVNRVQLYRPVYPGMFRRGLDEANLFMRGFWERMFERQRQDAEARALAKRREEWMKHQSHEGAERRPSH